MKVARVTEKRGYPLSWKLLESVIIKDKSTASMYTLKPIISLPEQIQLPKVMYELPKIQGGEEDDTSLYSDEVAYDIGRQQPLPEINLLEARQMRILRELCDLREHVEILCMKVRLSDVVPIVPCESPYKAQQKAIKAEVVVYANPASPPYSILALQRIWKDTRFNVETHRHSTVTDAPIDSFEKYILTNTAGDAVHTIDLKLIWKDVQDIQFITKVYEYPLEGEANLLHYLARLIENYDYEKVKSLAKSVTIDTVLDLCLRLSYEEPRNINAITAKFTSYLDKNQWLLDSTEPTIVDAAVWSIIKRVAENKVPPKMKRWYGLCERTFLSV